MIGLILGTILFCVIVAGALILFKDYVPANVQKFIWLVVFVVILLWRASYFGYVPAHFAHGRATA